MAKNMGAVLLEPSLFDVNGMEGMQAPVNNNDPLSERVLFQTEYIDEANSIPASSEIPPRTLVHFCTPNSELIQYQSSYFMVYNFVVNPCSSSSNACSLGKDVGDCSIL